MEDSQQSKSAEMLEMNDQDKGEGKMQNDTTARLRSSGRSRRPGSRSPKRSSHRSGRSPTSQSQPTQWGDIEPPFASPGASEKKRKRNSRGSHSSPLRENGRRGGRNKTGSNSRSTTNTLSTGVDIVSEGAGALTAETVNEQSEANRERIRDLEVQSDQIQQRIGDTMNSRKDTSDGQEATSNGDRRMTICKVLGVAAVYLAGVGTGFLVSELRQRQVPAKEIYVTQSPTPAVVPSIDATLAPTAFSYDGPTKEDCFAIESKEEVEGQDGMITRSYDVHFDVQLNDLSSNWYRRLEDGLTETIIPDLACCKHLPAERRLVTAEAPMVGFSIRAQYNRMLKNIRCVVANGSTRGQQDNSNGENCVELTGDLCLPAVVTLDLVLKGDEPDGDIIDLVRHIIQGDGSETLVEKYDLETNVFSVVKLVDVVNHIASEAPTGPLYASSRPTVSPTMTSTPVVGPTMMEPTPSPVTQPATPRPILSATKSPTSRPAPVLTPTPSPGPSTQLPPDPTPLPTSEPSSGPTESPSSSPSQIPTLSPSSSPSSSPTTPMPSLTLSAAPTGRRGALEAILTPVVGIIDEAALDWLADTDMWSPPATESDPDPMWVERYVMVKFYLSTNGASWTSKGGWMTSTTVCDWSPGTCNGNNRVRAIDLDGNGLSGTIPTEIGLLGDLDLCSLDNNAIGGTVPMEIGLPKLAHFSVSENDLTGRIPSELGLATMTSLDLSSNQLSGSIPSEVLLGLSSLSEFRVNFNSLTGTIGSELGAMAEIQFLVLRYNQFSGPLPSELGLLKNLTFVTVEKCSFTGSIPSELGMATNVKRIDFDFNDLSGTIPTTLGQLTKLTALDLDRTNLSGPVPTELGRLTALAALSLGDTNLSGLIPSELGLLSNMEDLDIANTNVNGSIPDLSALVNLGRLDLANCQLTGSIPPGMFNDMLNLYEINFSQNSLTGAIPAVPNQSLLTSCSYSSNCFTIDLANAGTCDLSNNCA